MCRLDCLMQLRRRFLFCVAKLPHLLQLRPLRIGTLQNAPGCCKLELKFDICCNTLCMVALIAYFIDKTQHPDMMKLQLADRHNERRTS